MAGYAIQAIDEANFSEIPPFLIRSIQSLNSSQDPSHEPVDQPVRPDTLAGDYRWLLDEDNPDPVEGIPPGEIIRDDQGSIVGMICYHPVFFRLGDRRLLGLGVHNFYVDPAVRMQGFILFRRYLNQPQADFCFSTTCNANSSPLWAKCGAAEVPNSDAEYLLVFRTGAVMQEVAINKRLPKALSSGLRLVGPLADLVLRPGKTAHRFAVERCDDWDRLSAIAAEHRDPSRLTPDRRAAIMKRTYEAMTRIGVAAGNLDGTYLFNDPSGREGWFSVRARNRGRLGQIRGVDLLDIVWPRNLMTFEDVLPAIIDVVRSHADLLSIRDRIALGLRPGMAGFRRRPFAAPEAFLFTRKQPDLPGPSELGQIANLPEAFAV